MRNDTITDFANDHLGVVTPGLVGSGEDAPPVFYVTSASASLMVPTVTDATVQTIVISAAG
ncbi:hypothetical protein [Amycolatopsis sp. CA-230715]|uniref:hypothetical protein n=1 Tax=Amycolatopsis sp. CA-230715 TaxID=2745196 RepID=UPI001C03968C|nr:hypothetical protein [Amycolatopsis sp. CA-230715]QWF82694.1 hypothetical protein HUW46_06133 [Amycolatopsis sp. CA-230715]